jgi:hypothetical protein
MSSITLHHPCQQLLPLNLSLVSSKPPLDAVAFLSRRPARRRPVLVAVQLLLPLPAPILAPHPASVKHAKLAAD